MSYNKNLLALGENLEKGQRGVILEGGSRCFAGNTPIIVSDSVSPKRIDTIQPGDFVLSHDESKGIDEFRVVTDVHIMTNNKPTVRIKLKNGETITCTEDHKFYFNGRYIEIKNILSLLKK